MDKRLNWIDIAKGFSILLVICGHNTFVLSGGGAVFNRIIGAYDMPLFFITAGYFARKKDVDTYIRNSFSRLIIPYLFTSAVLIFVDVFRNFRHGTLYHSFGDYFVSWICGYGFPYNKNLLSFGALWFLTALFCSNVIFDILLNIIYDDRVLFASCVFICGIGLAISKFVCLPFNIDIGMYAIIFECYGYLIKKYIRFDDKKMALRILVFSCVTYIAGVYVYSYDLNTRLYTYPIISTIGAIGGTTIFFFFSQFIDRIKWLRTIFGWCGRNSLTILCLHMLEHSVIPWSKIGYLYSNYFFLVAIKIALIVFGTLVIKRIPLVNYIYGYKLVNAKRS